MKKIILILFTLTLVFLVSTPGILYCVGLYNIEGRPNLPLNQYLEEQQIAGYKFLVRKNIKMHSLKKLNPWSYLKNIFIKATSSNAKANPYTLYLWGVARNYNNIHLRKKTSFWHRLSGSSLTIWLTRNYTKKQLLEGIK